MATTQIPEIIPTEALLGEVEDPKLRAAIRRVLRDHRDTKGRLRGEVVSPPKPGSHRYPYRRWR